MPVATSVPHHAGFVYRECRAPQSKNPPMQKQKAVRADAEKECADQLEKLYTQVVHEGSRQEE
eukprot:7178784-Prorocentrum_lima.AAC.1